MTDDREHSEFTWGPVPEAVVDRDYLGEIDASAIPSGFGLVAIDGDMSAVTNDTSDVRLFLDKNLSDHSSLQAKTVDIGDILVRFSSYLQTAKIGEHDDFSKTTQVTSSAEGTEFIIGTGTGKVIDDPITFSARAANFYSDPTTIHLAMIKTASVRGDSLYALVNEILYEYTPSEDHVVIRMHADVTRHPPRPVGEIEMMISGGGNLRVVDIEYYEYVRGHPEDHLAPLEWHRENKKEFTIARTMYERTKKRIQSADFFPKKQQPDSDKD